jgi:hypothetical protein
MFRQDLFGNGQPFDVMMKNPPHPAMTMRLAMSLGSTAAAFRMEDDFGVVDLEASSIEVRRLRA